MRRDKRANVLTDDEIIDNIEYLFKCMGKSDHAVLFLTCRPIFDTSYKTLWLFGLQSE